MDRPIQLDLLINGNRQPASDGARSEVRSPHDGRVVGTVPRATAADLDAAVQAAHSAFKHWSTLTSCEREKIIRNATAFVRATPVAPRRCV